MEVFNILGTVSIDITKAKKNIDSVSKESQKIGEGFEKSNAQAGRNLSEIAAANGKTVNELRSEASKIAAEYRKQGMDASSAMKKAYSDIGYESGNASKKISSDAKDAEGKSKKSFEGIGNAAKSIGKGIVGVGAAIGGAFIASVEGTRDYREEMGKLEAAFLTAGHSSEEAKSTYSDLNAVMGDSEAAVEASQHLANIADNEDELADLTNSLTGAYAKFGSSLPLEGLAEGILHSSELGSVQGSLADALEWSGITVEDFNAQLAECSSVEERQDLIANTLRETYSKSAEQYKETNKDVMEAEKANERLTDSMASLGAIGEPIMTVLKNAISGVIEKALPFIETMASKIPSAAETTRSKFAVVIPYLQNAWQILWSVIQTVWNTVGKPVFEYVVQNVQKVVAFFQQNFPQIQKVVQDVFSIIKNLWENVLKPVLVLLGNFIKNTLLPIWSTGFDSIMKVVQTAFNGIINLWNKSLKPILNGIITFVSGVLTGDWKKAWNGLSDIVTGVFSGVESAIETAKDVIGTAIDAIVDFFDITLKFSGISMPDISIKWAKEPAWMYEAAKFLGMEGIPKFSVTWNALGGILKKPTIFGAYGDTLLGGGEAGDEAIAPIDVLQQYVRTAVQEENSEMIRIMSRMYDLIATYLPDMADKVEKDIILNDGVLVGRLAPVIDKELGMIYMKKSRGNT